MKFSTLSLLFVALLALFIAGSSAESIRGQKLATSTNEEATVEATSTDTNADADDDDAALIETNVDADADDDDDDDALIETNADDDDDDDTNLLYRNTLTAYYTRLYTSYTL
jgi:hypothetical protein